LALVGPAAQAAAPVGQGFTITPSDLAFILKQIKIAEHHANTYTADNPCGTLVGNGPNQIPSPLVSYGLRTVDGSCNNLIADQENFGAADQRFPRLTTPEFHDAEPVPAGFPGAPGSPTSYKQKKGFVYDSQPRVISNLIVDQTSSNPAAVAAAENPVRTQGNEGVVACKTDPAAADCVPDHETLFIPNVTTDVGLSPPYNQLFTLFGQFFDHGVDLTTKSGGTVFVPLKDDDPLIAGPDHVRGNADDLPPSQRFMVLTRAQNQPGPDGVVGDLPSTPNVDESADDVQDATNTDSPWVDQSQTYTSHPSHQVFLREYVLNAQSRPVSTGKLLASADGGMATWALVKQQAASKLGLKLTDLDVLNIPMIAADPYGMFIPGDHGFPQYVTDTGLVEGDPSANNGQGVPVPANAEHVVNCAPNVSCNEGFLVDIAHNADPSPQDVDHNPATPPVAPVPDLNKVPSHDFASQPPGTYDDELLNMHFCAGDGRVNENIGLSAIHQIFHSEHDRLVDDIKRVLTADAAETDTGAAALPEWKLTSGADGWNGERLFQAARFVTEMEYQHIVFEEFARKVAPAINPFEPFAFTQTELNPAIKAEFAHAVYRFGHSMLTDSVDRINADGSHNDTPLLDAFLNPIVYTQKTKGGPSGALTSEQAAGSILMGASDETGNELDEFVTETLRNNLLGLPLDLATINMTRAREAGIPPLNEVRREIFASTNDGQLKPYSSWMDFGLNMKHPESLANFVAAYGEHPTVRNVDTIDGKRAAGEALVYGEAGPDGAIVDDSLTPENETADNIPSAEVPRDRLAFLNSTGAWANASGGVTTTGVDGVDLWVGGLAEKTNLFGGLLGSTFNYVFENQLTDLQNSDRLYYLARTPGMNLRTQLESNSFAELIMRNTDAHSLKADAFGTADCKFELKNLAGTPGGFTQFGNNVTDDLSSECDEGALLVRLPDGTIRYRERNSVDPAGINGQSVYNGTAGVDRVWGGVDNDTFLGNEGNDVIEGNDGADVALGGDGNDIVTDSAGDDVLKGGPGNDALDSGPGLDILMGGDGKDFTNGGANANETFAGPGDDFVIAGQSLDAVFGDGGDDYEEGGDQPDLLQGDAGNLFFLDDGTRPGHDILVGQGGDDDYDMEGGDDIGLGGPGIEKVAGAAGYDWEIGLGDPQAQNQDLGLPLPGADILVVDVRDKFNEVEALSGWKFDDVLRGDDIKPSQVGGVGFIGCDALDQAGLDRIQGLDAIVPGLGTSSGVVAQASASGTCPLRGKVWGGGNILLGGAGSDTLEGRGGNDIIDGDRYLNVRLSVRTNPADPATEIGSASPDGPGQSAMSSQYLHNSNGSLTGPTLQEAVFNGTVDPVNIVVVREILSANNTDDVDTAVFSDVRAAYQCAIGDDAPAPCPTDLPGGPAVRVIHEAGGGGDGSDAVRNVEVLQFADTVPPGTAPTSVRATAGKGSATVRFTPPANRSVTRFDVEVVEAANPETVVKTVSAAAVEADVAGGDGALTSVVVPSLSSGTSYQFRVRATNGMGPGPFSGLSNAVTPQAPTVADAPILLTATADDGSATITWLPPLEDGGSPVSAYEVRVVDASTHAELGVRRAAAADRSLVVDGLSNGRAYQFQVRALNVAGPGTYSALSDKVTPATAPDAPTIADASAGNGSATVRWAAPADNGGSTVTGYEVRVVEDASGTLVAVRSASRTATSLVVTGLTNGTRYRFQVSARNDAGLGARSARSNIVRPSAPPGQPRIGTASAGGSKATAHWRKPLSNGGAPIEGYVVTALRIGKNGGVASRVESRLLTPDSRSKVLRLPRGTYRFVVVARNVSGDSRPSERSNRVRLG
jgi:Ca2+-binding RTX toxin-like protein